MRDSCFAARARGARQKLLPLGQVPRSSLRSLIRGPVTCFTFPLPQMCQSGAVTSQNAGYFRHLCARRGFLSIRWDLLGPTAADLVGSPLRRGPASVWLPTLPLIPPTAAKPPGRLLRLPGYPLRAAKILDQGRHDEFSGAKLRDCGLWSPTLSGINQSLWLRYHPKDRRFCQSFQSAHCGCFQKPGKLSAAEDNH